MSSSTALRSGIFSDEDDDPRRGESAFPSQRYLPLLDVTMTVKVVMFTCRAVLTQTFQNDQTKPIREAKYAFPLYENSAIVSFTCTIQGRTRPLNGIVKPNNAARHDYDKALSTGQPAGLLEEHTPDVFTTTLGN